MKKIFFAIFLSLVISCDSNTNTNYDMATPVVNVPSKEDLMVQIGQRGD
jgi:hypothetical protein